VVRYDSQVGNAFAKNISNWQGRSMAYPTNVIHMATECGNKSHSAAFPLALPQWFIRLFTDSGDAVLDPFVGSGTTLDAALQIGRVGVGIDTSPNFVELCNQKLAPLQGKLLEERKPYVVAKKGKAVRLKKYRSDVSSEEVGGPGIAPT